MSASASAAAREGLENVESTSARWVLRSISSKVPSKVALGVMCIIGNRLLRSKRVLKLFGQESGDTTGSTIEDHDGLLLNLPSKIRQKIWNHLNPNDLLIIRQVCGQFQRDIDYRLGLHAIIDSNCSESFEWFQSVTLQSCHIKFLEDPTNWSFVAKPSSLYQISFDESFPCDLGIISTIFSKFHAIRELIFCIEDVGGDGDGFCCQIITDFIQLFVNNFVYSIHIEFLPSSWKLLWIVQFPKSRFKDNIFTALDVKVPPRVKDIYLKMPMVSPHHRGLWLTFLYNLISLRSLYLNLGDINWELYAPIIEGNSKTLVTISLSHVRTYEQECMEVPFNWGIFEECHLLKVLDIACNMRLIPQISIGIKMPMVPAVNVDKLPTKNLQVLLLSYMSFRKEELQLIMGSNWAPELVTGCLFHCGVEGMSIAPPILNLSEHPIDICRSELMYYPSMDSDICPISCISSAFRLLARTDYLLAVLVTGYLIYC